MRFEKRRFSNNNKRKNTDLFILKNKSGNEVAITNYGGAIVAIMMPDKMVIMPTLFKATTIFKT